MHMSNYGHNSLFKINIDNTSKLCNVRLINVTMRPFACLCVCSCSRCVCLCYVSCADGDRARCGL